MSNMTFYEELQWRGLVQDISSPELIDKLNEGGLTFYIGTDPTADSMHIGHYSSFLISKNHCPPPNCIKYALMNPSMSPSITALTFEVW